MVRPEVTASPQVLACKIAVSVHLMTRLKIVVSPVRVRVAP
jgi:hypothetical protein